MGAQLAVVTEAEAAVAIVEAAVAHQGHWTITANLDHLRCYRREPFVRDLIDEADLVVADGNPLVWATRLAGTPLPERVAGASLIWSICECASQRHVSVFLLGGNPGVVEDAAELLCSRYPGLEVVGTFCPSFGFEEDPEELHLIERRVTEASPGIVLVGLGFPKQDLLIRRLRQALPQTSFVGVGVSFSFVVGEFSRGPRWVQRIGFEWLYRLLQEPRRLARRYLWDGMPFALLLLSSAVQHRLRLQPRSAEGDWGRVTRALPLSLDPPISSDPERRMTS